MIVKDIQFDFTVRSLVRMYSLLVEGKVHGRFTGRSFVVSGHVPAGPIVSRILDNKVS